MPPNSPPAPQPSSPARGAGRRAATPATVSTARMAAASGDRSPMTPAPFSAPHAGSGLDAQKRAKLARMADQIGTFFSAYPEEQAVAAIAEHINQFWSARMRADFLRAFDAGSDEISPPGAARPRADQASTGRIDSAASARRNRCASTTMNEPGA